MKEKEKEKWKKFAHVISSKNKKAIIEYMSKGPSTPTEISTNLKINPSITSRLLRKMTEDQIVECLNPTEKKGRLYYLTDLGNWIADHI